MPQQSPSHETTNTQPREESGVAPGLLNALKEAVTKWLAHKSPKAGASLAYYSIFSIGPLIVVVMSIATLVFQREGVQREVADAIQGLIGTATLIFAALGVVVQLKEALNKVWEVKPRRRSGIWGFVRDYVLSLAGVAALGFLLLISMLLTAGLAAIGKSMGGLVPEPLMQGLSFLVSFAVIAVMFALLFKWMPDAPVRWRDVVLGAIGTAALFEIGKF